MKADQNRMLFEATRNRQSSATTTSAPAKTSAPPAVSEARAVGEEVSQGRAERVRGEDRRPVEGLDPGPANVLHRDRALAPPPHEERREHQPEQEQRAADVADAQRAIRRSPPSWCRAVVVATMTVQYRKG